ncbi:hypothetical protein H359_0756 [Chlamydia ibidis 10-1398/6]|uniref:Uncharacterized protein n=1 Tax=Chlamydia ibidis 10-1398/6 TaxID=1046581 RepID=A0ABN0MZG6_9CHLA|nr:hypothetical protein H359_0756 [Chlamydia ibidis 10-1398/6]
MEKVLTVEEEESQQQIAPLVFALLHKKSENPEIVTFPPVELTMPGEELVMYWKQIESLLPVRVSPLVEEKQLEDVRFRLEKQISP